MAFQSVFKRYELKYLLTEQQKQKVMEAMEPYMQLDRYGHTVIRNLYFDTYNYRLIRHSIEQPAYKEKLRIRSYGRAKPDTEVFVELKKKYKHVVYKRRISLTEKEAMDWASGVRECEKNTQISREVDYFFRYYKELHPVIFLSYERDAYCADDGSAFRVTFDNRILYRQEDLSLESEIYGEPLLPEGTTLMELKCPGAIPMWMVRVLSQEHIYKTSFSKYGTAYRTGIFPHLTEEEKRHA